MYLPKSTVWYDAFSFNKLGEGAWITRPAQDLASYPLFLRGGHIIPEYVPPHL